MLPLLDRIRLWMLRKRMPARQINRVSAAYRQVNKAARRLKRQTQKTLRALELMALTEATNLKIKLDKGAKAPTRAHDTDGGLDLYAMDGCIVQGRGAAKLRTGVHVQLPPGCVGVLMSKSGLNVNHDITSTGLIDEGYTGEITVKLYNHGERDYRIQAGEKISQLVVIPTRYEQVEIVDEIDGGERGSAGFGSTGRM